MDYMNYNGVIHTEDTTVKYICRKSWLKRYISAAVLFTRIMRIRNTDSIILKRNQALYGSNITSFITVVAADIWIWNSALQITFFFISQIQPWTCFSCILLLISATVKGGFSLLHLLYCVNLFLLSIMTICFSSDLNEWFVGFKTDIHLIKVNILHPHIFHHGRFFIDVWCDHSECSTALFKCAYTNTQTTITIHIGRDRVFLKQCHLNNRDMTTARCVIMSGRKGER